MIKLTSYFSPIALITVAACSGGGSTHVTVKPDAAGSGSAIDAAPTLCGISMAAPAMTVPAAQVGYRTEDHVFAARTPPVAGGSTTAAGEFFAFGILPASPENTGTGQMADSIQIVVFEQSLNQGFPIGPKTFTIGALGSTPPGDNETNPFVDNPVPTAFQIEVDAFDGTDPDPTSHWLGAGGTVTITSDTIAKFKGSFDNVTLVHYAGMSTAADAMTCQTMSGTFSFDAAPGKRSTLTGRDDGANDLVSQKQEYVRAHRNEWKRPTF